MQTFSKMDNVASMDSLAVAMGITDDKQVQLIGK